MNISPVNCSPIKPQAFGSEGYNEDNYNKVLVLTNQMNDELVHSDNIKTPIAAVASVALAGAVAFVSGKKVAQVATTVCKNLPAAFEKTLKTASKSLQNAGEKLTGANSGKLLKLKNYTGKAISGIENAARTAYKKLAYSGIASDIPKSDIPKRAFQNLAGWAAVAVSVPSLCAKDANANGVSDLVEKNTNAYDGISKKCTGAVQSASKIADLVSELT